MKFKVSAILPIPAEIYFVERDSSAFRSLVAEVGDDLIFTGKRVSEIRPLEDVEASQDSYTLRRLREEHYDANTSPIADLE